MLKAERNLTWWRIKKNLYRILTNKGNWTQLREIYNEVFF